jgi:hypothetical protein
MANDINWPFSLSHLDESASVHHDQFASWAAALQLFDMTLVHLSKQMYSPLRHLSLQTMQAAAKRGMSSGCVKLCIAKASVRWYSTSEGVAVSPSQHRAVIVPFSLTTSTKSCTTWECVYLPPVLVVPFLVVSPARCACYV